MIDFDFNTFIYLWGTQAIIFLCGVGLGVAYAYAKFISKKEKK